VVNSRQLRRGHFAIVFGEADPLDRCHTAYRVRRGKILDKLLVIADELV
jgi:hypothetical protein